MTYLTTYDDIVAANPDGESRLGVFWFIPADGGGARLIEEPIPATEIPEVGGFKTYDPGAGTSSFRTAGLLPGLRGHDPGDPAL